MLIEAHFGKAFAPVFPIFANMILHYLWIEDFNGIKNQGFNFGPEFWFDYNSESNKLVVGKKEPLPEGFFTPSGENLATITNLSCIVGRNGTGKTSALREIRNLFGGTDTSEPITGGWICVIESDSITPNVDRPRFLLSGSSSIALAYMNLESNNVESINEQDFTREKFSFTNVGNRHLIYYSNIFDFNSMVDGRSQDLYSNISTNQLFWDGMSTDNLGAGELDALHASHIYRFQELDRNVRFLADSSARNSLPEFDLPNGLRFEWSNDEWNRLEEHSSEEMAAVIDSNRSSNSFLSRIYLLTLCSFLDDLKPDPTVKANLALLNEGKEDLGTLAIQFFKQIAIDFPTQKDKVNDIVTFLENMEKLVASPTTLQSDYKSVCLVDDSKKWNTGIGLLKQLSEALPDAKWLYFSWRKINRKAAESDIIQHLEDSGISSGEQSMLTFFSRFHGLKNSMEGKLGEHLIIMIDEGTESFHPEWQRRFLKLVLDYLPKLFGPSKKLQFILTTNSPFLLSDIPKDNIIFLGNKDQQQAIGQTFGANIHSLLSQAMFLDSTMGAFAEAKIQDVIYFLLSDKKSPPTMDRATAQQHIHLIGEPLIRNELQRMLDSKRLEEIDELAALKERVRILEEQNIRQGGV